MDFQQMRILDLRKELKKRGLKGYSSLKKRAIDRIPLNRDPSIEKHTESTSDC